MQPQTTQILSFAKYTAIISFILGTLIFLAYCYSSDTNLLFLGYLYIAIAGLVNFIVLVVLIIASLKQTIEVKHKIRKRAALMLLNFPVAIVYCLIAAQILGYVRIHLVNATKEPISNIHIYGCDDKNLGNLDAGESKNVWIKIDNDCGITMEYMMNDKRIEEVIMGYCTSGMGQKITYNIGVDNDPATFEEPLAISANNLMGNWYLNEWTLCHTLYFTDTVLTIDQKPDTIYMLTIDNHIDTLYFLTIDVIGDTLELRSGSSDEIFRNKIINITHEKLVLDGILDVKEKRTYFRTKKEFQ